MRISIGDRKCLVCSGKLPTEVVISHKGIGETKCAICGNSTNEIFAHSIWFRTMHNSQKLLRDKEYRGAVIEIFSAWESFITQRIRLWLYKHKSSSNDLKKCVQVAAVIGKRQLAQQMHRILYPKLAIPNDNNWAALRNKVAHGGYIPDENEAREIVEELSKAIFRIYDPPNGDSNSLFLDEYWR